MSGKRFEKMLAKQVEDLGEGLRADLREPKWGLEFAERLLESIIRAHPQPDGKKSDLKRLSAAMIALFGARAPRRRADTDEDMLTLRAMAEIFHASGGKMSADKLAEKGAALASG